LEIRRINEQKKGNSRGNVHKIQKEEARIVQAILDIVRETTKNGFCELQANDHSARMPRQMALSPISSLQHYKDYLMKHRHEAYALMKNFLIHVTSFFPGPAGFLRC